MVNIYQVLRLTARFLSSFATLTITCRKLLKLYNFRDLQMSTATTEKITTFLTAFRLSIMLRQTASGIFIGN